MENSNAGGVAADVLFTTQQAADYLNVSRQYLMKLLAAGSVPPLIADGPGDTIRFSELEAYRTKVHADRMAALEELTRLDQELGLGYE